MGITFYLNIEIIFYLNIEIIYYLNIEIMLIDWLRLIVQVFAQKKANVELEQWP